MCTYAYGVKNGKEELYDHGTGELLHTNTYIMGKREGHFKYYYNNSMLYQEAHLKNG